LHTAVNGPSQHGFHVFNQEGIIESLRLNNFEILYLKYSSNDGALIKNPSYGDDVMIWVVAKKLKSVNKFIIPQQREWWDTQHSKAAESKSSIYIFLQIIWKSLKSIKYSLKSFLDT